MSHWHLPWYRFPALSAALAFGFILAAAGTELVVAESEFLRGWNERADAARAAQPAWVGPLASSNGRLSQEVRFDHYHERLSGGGRLDIEGAGKGLSLIVAPHTQVTVAFPPYQRRHTTTLVRGFADWPGAKAGVLSICRVPWERPCRPTITRGRGCPS
jgi:hypothetical protein